MEIRVIGFVSFFLYMNEKFHQMCKVQVVSLYYYNMVLKTQAVEQKQQGQN